MRSVAHVAPVHSCGLVFVNFAIQVTALVIQRQHSWAPQSTSKRVQGKRPLWTFWGDDVQPDLVRLCLSTWQHHAGNAWQLYAISSKTVNDYVGVNDLPPQFYRMEASFQADAIRLAVLRRFGGLWVDATTIATQDVSEWVGTAFADGSRFVGFYIDHYTLPRGPPLVASWAMAIRDAEQPMMVGWHTAYLQLWKNRTSVDGISDDTFFKGADFARVNPLEWDYLHIELILLTLMERDSSLRGEIDQSSTLMRAESTAYGLQASLGLAWMANNKCAPVTVPLTDLPSNAQNAIASTPLVKLRHEDRQWLISMSARILLRSTSSVIGTLLSHNTELPDHLATESVASHPGPALCDDDSSES